MCSEDRFKEIMNNNVNISGTAYTEMKKTMEDTDKIVESSERMLNSILF